MVLEKTVKTVGFRPAPLSPFSLYFEHGKKMDTKKTNWKPALIGCATATAVFIFLHCNCRNGEFLRRNPWNYNFSSDHAPRVYVPTGPIVKQIRELEPFEKLSVGTLGNFELIPSEQERIEIETHSDLMDKIRIENEEKSLSIGLGPVSKVKKLHYKIYYTRITDLHVQETSRLRSEKPLKGDSLKLTCSGVSRMNLPVESKEVHCSCMGASRVEISGNAENAILEAAGASVIHANSLESNTKKISAVGASNIEAGTAKKMEISALGASRVKYRGNPDITKRESLRTSRISGD